MAIQLTKLYRAHNRRYFGNKLPKDVEVFYSWELPADMMEGAFIPEAGVPWPKGCGPKPEGYQIRILKLLEIHGLDRVAEGSLLHAMVHIEGTLGKKNLFKHGAHFNKRMNDLVDAGAFDGLL